MAAGTQGQRRTAPLAGPLSPPARRRGLLASTALVLALHALALGWLATLLRPPSLLQSMAPPFYTRSITPEAPAEPVAALAAPVQPQPSRPTALIRPAPAKKEAPQPSPPAPKPEPAASAAKPADPTEPPPAAREDETPDAVAQHPEPPASLAPSAEAPEAPEALAAPEAIELPPAAADTEPIDPDTTLAAAPAPIETPEPPAAPASAADPAFLANWPRDTRLTYKLGGNYRGELHGSARVLWQREGTRYHTAVEMSAGLLASLSFTSQGEITASGLMPEVYEENLRGRRRGVRLGEDVRLNNGTRVPRPEAVQDTASQFVELGHRFATGQVPLVPGAQVDFSMARPGGIDDWTYDVIAEEVLYLPRLGPVATYHLRPRPLSKPRGPISAEIWYAPSLQHLPVRIKITQGPDTWIDLMVDTIEQR